MSENTPVQGVDALLDARLRRDVARARGAPRPEFLEALIDDLPEGRERPRPTRGPRRALAVAAALLPLAGVWLWFASSRREPSPPPAQERIQLGQLEPPAQDWLDPEVVLASVEVAAREESRLFAQDVNRVGEAIWEGLPGGLTLERVLDSVVD